MNTNLYSPALMRLAADAIGHGRLTAPSGSATEHNPLCGDRITVDVRRDGITIAEMSHDAKACIICQAAASLLAQEIVGKDLATLSAVESDLTEMLAGRAPETLTWPALSDFAPVSDHKGRHMCVKLPFMALRRALAT